MMFALFCLSITLIVVFVDAMCCVALERQFVWQNSILFALFWPITVILFIIAAARYEGDEK